MGVMDEWDRIYGSSNEPDESQEEQQSDGLTNIVDELSDDSIDEELAEAEKRLAKAAYYKAIVRDGIVEEDGSKLATEVNDEAKLWARYMMARLLRQREATPPPAPVAAQFTDPEARALKQLAAIALAKSGELPSAPAVRRVQPAAPPAAPSVKRQASQESPRPAPKTQAKPATAKKPANKPAAKPAKAPAKQPAKTEQEGPITAALLDSGELDEDSIPSDVVFIDPRDNKKYKFVPNKMYDPDIEGSKPRGKLCVENQAVRGVNPLPMPSARAMEYISAQQAQETIEAGQTAAAIPTAGDPAMFGLAAAAALRR